MENYQASTRPDQQSLVELGKYLRDERIRIGLTSSESFIDYLEEVTRIPPDTVTARMFYNIESAKTVAKVEAMPLVAIACFAEKLFYKKPSIKYLINPRTNKPFTSQELLAICYGWLDLKTGKKLVDCELF